LELLVKVEGLIKLPNLIEENVYRIVQEAINNTKKHGDTTQVKLNLIQKLDYLYVTIVDFVKGFDATHPNSYHSHDINNMKQQSKKKNSKLIIESQHNKSKQIYITKPL